VYDRVARIAGRKQNLRVRQQLANNLSKLGARHFGHDDVRKQQIRPRTALDKPDGGAASR
jgi:hypothetical protein